MSNAQEIINKMHTGDINAILDGICSDSPILILNAILSGTRMGLHNDVFVHGVKQATKNDTALLHLSISQCAHASLDILGIRKYMGEDSYILELISTGFHVLHGEQKPKEEKP